MSAVEFSVNTAELGRDAFIVTLTGEADVYTAPELERALEGVVALGGTSVVVDLASVSFIDSTVLGILVGYQSRFRDRGGDLVIVSEDRRVLRTFEVTGLDQIFRIEQKLAEGIAAIVPR